MDLLRYAEVVPSADDHRSLRIEPMGLFLWFDVRNEEVVSSPFLFLVCTGI